MIRAYKIWRCFNCGKEQRTEVNPDIFHYDWTDFEEWQYPVQQGGFIDHICDMEKRILGTAYPVRMEMVNDSDAPMLGGDRRRESNV